jgi:hypothetical protein
MASAEDLASLQLYMELMEEVKARAASINTLTNDQRGIPSPMVREYCYLQLRMLCELIALGCLVAHGDIVASSPASLRKAYDPAEILQHLESLHPDFYPVPVIPIQTAEGWRFDHYDDRPFLAKRDLRALWSRCGSVLHRGNLRKLIGPKTPVQRDFADVAEGGQKVLNLLSAHRIIRLGGRVTFIAFLQVDQLGGAVQVAIGEAPLAMDG